MIEYDKANIISSYPSLTEYEVATVLDKAYNALIAQKVTGNNVRRMGFETDVKAVEDLSPLITRKQVSLQEVQESPYSTNIISTDLPKDQLYFISAFINADVTSTRWFFGDPLPATLSENGGVPMDGETTRPLPIQLVSHQMAQKFYSTAYNLPWIKIPVGYIELERLYIMYDPLSLPALDVCNIVYIRKPNVFAKDLEDRSKFPAETGVYTYFQPSDADQDNEYYDFECNDTVAEELISLAIVFALENIESARLTTKLNIRGLEA